MKLGTVCHVLEGPIEAEGREFALQIESMEQAQNFHSCARFGLERSCRPPANAEELCMALHVLAGAPINLDEVDAIAVHHREIIAANLSLVTETAWRVP